MKRKLPWKRVFWGIVIAAVCCELWVEFDIAFLFIAGVFGIGILIGLVQIWWTGRRKKKVEEDLETQREKVRQEEASRRREACREARYYPEEVERIEARLEQTLGPIALRDPEEDGDVLCLDIAMIPPTESLPFWKAATVGAGAYTIPAERAVTPYRAELVLALPPDWDPSDRWPLQVLRDAARRFLVVEGFLGLGSLYRGFSVISAGFAEAEVTDDFPGLPDLGFAPMPGAPPVYFFWLLPLLKPEAEYFQKRGWPNLERRFRLERPWADPGRRPVAESLTWFQEDIAPFAWSEEDGLYCLGLNVGEYQRELFAREGYTNMAWAMEDLARKYLRRHQPGDEPFVDFACEDEVFFAASGDREIMEKLALGLSDLLRDRPEELQRMLRWI